MSDMLFPDVKTFYDQQGRPCEVLISYETFRQIENLFRKLQAYFWTDEWQARILEAEADVTAGRTFRTTAETLDAALDWLDE